MSKKKKQWKWECTICLSHFPTKKGLCEDLAKHFEDASQEAYEAEDQLEELGVKDINKYL